MTVDCMSFLILACLILSLLTAHILYTRTHPFVSAVYFHFGHNQLYINLVCFDSISAKDNLVLLSGAVRLFRAHSSGIRAQNSDKCLSEQRVN